MSAIEIEDNAVVLHLDLGHPITQDEIELLFDTLSKFWENHGPLVDLTPRVGIEEITDRGADVLVAFADEVTLGDADLIVGALRSEFHEATVTRELATTEYDPDDWS